MNFRFFFFSYFSSSENYSWRKKWKKKQYLFLVYAAVRYLHYFSATVLHSIALSLAFSFVIIFFSSIFNIHFNSFHFAATDNVQQKRQNRTRAWQFTSISIFLFCSNEYEIYRMHNAQCNRSRSRSALMMCSINSKWINIEYIVFVVLTAFKWCFEYNSQTEIEKISDFFHSIFLVFLFISSFGERNDLNFRQNSN